MVLISFLSFIQYIFDMFEQLKKSAASMEIASGFNLDDGGIKRVRLGRFSTSCLSFGCAGERKGTLLSLQAQRDSSKNSA